jgi:hypothetical protein
VELAHLNPKTENGNNCAFEEAIVIGQNKAFGDLSRNKRHPAK